MKLRNLFLAALAGLFALTGCDLFETEKPVIGLEVSPDNLVLNQEGGSETIKLSTSQAWTITLSEGAEAWLTVSPLSGTGSATVTVAASENSEKERTAVLSIQAGFIMAHIPVTQPGSILSGDGSKERPFSPAEARAWITANLKSGESTSVNYYVAGKIHKVQTTFADSGNFGNATFFMSEDGQSSQEDFEAFQVYYLGHRQWKAGDKDVQVGDDVIVCGPLTLYNTTPETVGKGAAYLYKLNDEIVEVDDPGTPVPGEPKGDGSQNNPFNVAAALDAVKNLTWTANDNYEKVGPYYVEGKVSRIAENFDAVGSNGTQYGNATFYIVDEGSDAEFCCYRVKYFDNKAWKTGDAPLLSVGDEVVIYSELMNYRGNTPETVSNSGYVVRINETTGSGGGETPPAEGNLTVSQILGLSNGTAFDSEASLVVAITTRGFVATDGTKNIYVYTQGTNFNGVANIGDKVKFSGKRDEYSGMPEVTPVTNVEVVSSNNQVSYPNPKDITATADSYTATEAEYISLTGTLAKSGNYYNLVLEGTEAKQGSIVYPAASLNADSYDKKRITVTGYFNGLTSQNKYINIITTKIEEAGDAPVSNKIKITSLSESNSVVSASWSAYNGNDLSHYYWTLSTTDPSSGAVLTVSEGATLNTSVRTAAGEDENVSDTQYIKWYYTGLVEGAVYSFMVVAINAEGATAASPDAPSTFTHRGSSQGTEETVVLDIAEYAAANSWANATQYSTATVDGVTFTAAGGGNTGKYYTSGNQWRFYQNESATLTVSVSGTLTSVTPEYASQNSGVLVDPTGAQQASGTKISVSGSSAKFTLANTANLTNGQVRFTKITVTYIAD